MEEADMMRELQVVFSVLLKSAPATSAVTLEVWVMEVPHDESTSFGIEEEYDADWAPKPKRAAKPGEGHDVERVTAQSDEIVGILKWLKDETSPDLSALEKERAEAQPRPARPPPWRDKKADQASCCRTEEAARQEVEEERTAETEL